jgi:hypothetical protein
MSISNIFSKAENKQAALIKLFVHWANSNKPYDFYSFPAEDKKGMYYSLQAMLSRFNKPSFRNKLKDDVFVIYDNQKLQQGLPERDRGMEEWLTVTLITTSLSSQPGAPGRFG